jgi:hypothetical protein
MSLDLFEDLREVVSIVGGEENVAPDRVSKRSTIDSLVVIIELGLPLIVDILSRTVMLFDQRGHDTTYSSDIGLVRVIPISETLYLRPVLLALAPEHSHREQGFSRFPWHTLMRPSREIKTIALE